MLIRFNSIRAMVLFHRVSQFTSSVYTSRKSYIKKIFSALTLAVVSILMFSCAVDKEIDNLAPGTNENAQLVLRLRAPSGYSVTTRSLTVKQENTIKDVYVLVFDKDDELVSIKTGSNVKSPVNTNPDSNDSYSGECSFTVTLKPSSADDEGDTYNLVVLANSKSIIENTIGSTVSKVNDKEYSAVMKLIYGQITGLMFSKAEDNTIPMSCETGQITIEPGNNSTDLSLMLTRSVARIDVGVGTATKDNDTGVWSWDGREKSEDEGESRSEGKIIPFRLEHVYVISPNKRYAVVPNETKLKAEMPTIPDETTAFSLDESETNFKFTITEETMVTSEGADGTEETTGGYTSQDIYVPEADIANGSDIPSDSDTRSETATSGDENHTNRMAIVVGGRYNGGIETFYRLDFADSDGNLMNVLRNHLYRFSISEVLGDGYSDVKSAYKAQSKNMTAKVCEWDEENLGNIAFDGQNYLSVSQSEFNFTCEAIEDKGENNVLFVKTDVTNGWFIEKIVEKVDGGEIPDGDTSWITVMMSDADESLTEIIPGDKTSSTTEEEVFLTVGNTEVARSAVIKIAAGRMRYSVTVNQSSTSALSVQLYKDDSPFLEPELVFVDNWPISPQTLNVKWEPKYADLIVRNTSVGALAQLSGTGIPNDNILGGNYGTGEYFYNITPTPFTDEEIASKIDNSFLEKVSKIDFSTTTSDGSTASSSIFLRQIRYDVLPRAVSYPISTQSQTHTIYIRANFDWKIIGVENTNNILSSVDELTKQTGSYNTTKGTPLSFTTAATDASKDGQTATITFSDATGKIERPVTITAIDALHVGRFGGKYAKINGVWKFTEPLYVQKEDASTGIVWASSEGSTNIKDETNGRQNTWDLSRIGISEYPAAELCYDKNVSFDSAADLTWYLPAKMQMMAIYAMNGSFGNNKLETSSSVSPWPYYWSSTEYNGSYSWHVYFIHGNTDYNSKTTFTSWVRCVREN